MKKLPRGLTLARARADQTISLDSWLDTFHSTSDRFVMVAEPNMSLRTVQPASNGAPCMLRADGYTALRHEGKQMPLPIGEDA